MTGRMMRNIALPLIFAFALISPMFSVAQNVSFQALTSNNKVAPAHVIDEALLAQMVIVEKEIVVGNETWYHVVQKMLPDAASDCS